MKFIISESNYKLFLPMAEMYYTKLYKEQRLNNTDKIILENYNLQKNLSQKAMVESFLFREDPTVTTNIKDPFMKRVIEYLKSKGISFVDKIYNSGAKLSASAIKELIQFLTNAINFLKNTFKNTNKLAIEKYNKIIDLLMQGINWLKQALNKNNNNNSKTKSLIGNESTIYRESDNEDDDEKDDDEKDDTPGVGTILLGAIIIFFLLIFLSFFGLPLVILIVVIIFRKPIFRGIKALLKFFKKLFKYASKKLDEGIEDKEKDKEEINKIAKSVESNS